MKLCGFPDCGRPHYGNGLCTAHNAQRRHGGLLKPIGSQHRKPSTLPHPTDPTLALVPLTQGYFAVISVIDAPAVGQYNWHVVKPNGMLYAARHQRTSKGKKTYLLLHRFVADEAGITAADEVDHENGNGLDCRRSNLRAASRSQQLQNTRLRRDNTSGVKGVSFVKNISKWAAEIKVDGKKTVLGYFIEKADAAAAVRDARDKLHGAFANHGTLH